jgi:methylenetetrahydrofolate reductase (NADPH)
MHAEDIFRSTRTTFSFEFFPPKSPEAVESLYETIRELEAYQPHFVSVTYGAGGSTRELTHDLVVRIKQTISPAFVINKMRSLIFSNAMREPA